MPKIITEDMIEQAAIKALQEWHDYTVLNCITKEPDILSAGTRHKDIPAKNAYNVHLKNILYLFNYNQTCVLSNSMETRLGRFAVG